MAWPLLTWADPAGGGAGASAKRHCELPRARPTYALDDKPPTRKDHFMSSYRLDALPETTVQVFNQEIDPVLTVDPGDTVLLCSLDASGSLDRQKTPGEDVPTMFSERRGHCLTGPIAVRGAMPGDHLAVRFVSIRPDD